MREERIGALLVTKDDRPVGIFTERDVLRRVALSTIGPETRLGDVMTPDPEALNMEAGIAFALNRMIVGGFRHVPIVDQDGRAVGVLSVREVVAFIVSLLPGRVHNLPPEPHLEAHSPDGG
jgi:CBS domain-containing protein